MQDLSQLKKDLHRTDLGRSDKLLIVVGTDGNKPKPVSEIRQIFVAAGLSQAKHWNISSMLSETKGLAIPVKGGWELSPQGLDHVQKIPGVTLKPATPVTVASKSLRQHVISIQNPDTRNFLEEAIGCLDANLLRAAVVLSWVGAVSVLYDHVVANHLPAFNAEATRRDPHWKPAKNRDDLARMKESDFLDVLEAISVTGKSVKKILKHCLELRNACGHPSSLQIGESTVAAHIEQLMANIFEKF